MSCIGSNKLGRRRSAKMDHGQAAFTVDGCRSRSSRPFLDKGRGHQVHRFSINYESLCAKIEVLIILCSGVGLWSKGVQGHLRPDIDCLFRENVHTRSSAKLSFPLMTSFLFPSNCHRPSTNTACNIPEAS